MLLWFLSLFGVCVCCRCCCFLREGGGEFIYMGRTVRKSKKVVWCRVHLQLHGSKKASKKRASGVEFIHMDIRSIGSQKRSLWCGGYLKTYKRVRNVVLNVEFIYMHEQVLFVHFYGNPALVIRFMQFYYYTARKPGTGADHAFFFKHCV